MVVRGLRRAGLAWGQRADRVQTTVSPWARLFVPLPVALGLMQLGGIRLGAALVLGGCLTLIEFGIRSFWKFATHPRHAYGKHSN